MEMQIITANKTLSQIISDAKEQFLSGEINPLEAWRNMTAFAKAIDDIKKDQQVKDYALLELSKYGKETQLYGCKMEQKETGVKYDYSECGDDELIRLIHRRSEIDEQIKERQNMLKGIKPTTSLLDENTGQVFKAPIRTSTTTIQVTFNKK